MTWILNEGNAQEKGCLLSESNAQVKSWATRIRFVLDHSLSFTPTFLFDLIFFSSFLHDSLYEHCWRRRWPPPLVESTLKAIVFPSRKKQENGHELNPTAESCAQRRTTHIGSAHMSSFSNFRCVPTFFFFLTKIERSQSAGESRQLKSEISTRIYSVWENVEHKK